MSVSVYRLYDFVTGGLNICIISYTVAMGVHELVTANSELLTTFHKVCLEGSELKTASEEPSDAHCTFLT